MTVRRRSTLLGCEVQQIAPSAWVAGPLIFWIRRRKQDSALHVRVMRTDKKPIESWDTLQAVKNLVAGPEGEAVEFYPAETVTIRRRNIRHLWVFPKISLGYHMELKCLNQVIS